MATTLLNPAAGGRGGGLEGVGGRSYTPDEQAALEKGGTVYKELCFACHGDDGRGAPAPDGSASGTRAPALAASPRVVGHRDYVIKALLHGLTGPVNGVSYTEVMIPMGQNPDDWIAAVGSYVRNAFGNRASMITAERRRARPRQRRGPQDGVERRRDRGIDAEDGDRRQRLEGDGEPQPGDGVRRLEHPAVDVGSRAGAGDVAAGRAAAAADRHGGAVRVGTGRRRSRARGARRADAHRHSAASAARLERRPPPTPPVGYPRAFDVQISMDGTTWGPAVATGKGTGTSTSVTFAPVRAKFVRITQTGSAADAPPWSVLRLRLYQAAGSGPSQ